MALSNLQTVLWLLFALYSPGILGILSCRLLLVVSYLLSFCLCCFLKKQCFSFSYFPGKHLAVLCANSLVKKPVSCFTLCPTSVFLLHTLPVNVSSCTYFSQWTMRSLRMMILHYKNKNKTWISDSWHRLLCCHWWAISICW